MKYGKKILAFLMALCMLAALAACSTPAAEPEDATNTQAPAQTQTPVSEPEALTFTPGTYQSQQAGHNGFIDVSVTFSDTAITAIEMTSGYETAGVSAKSVKTDLPKSIIDTQTLNVDTITGSTISSMAMLRAVEDCVNQAGGDPAALKPDKQAAATGDSEKTADVVIIGGGGAGLAAAVAAQQNGASVILVEKNGYVGGNSMVSGGIYNAADPDMQKAVESTEGVESLVIAAYSEEARSDLHKELMDTVKAEFEAHKASGATSLFDSPSFHALQTWNGGDKVANLELVKILTENALPSLEWMLEMGYEMKDFVNQGAGSLYQRTHTSIKPLGTGFIDAFTEQLSRGDATILYNTTAKELIMEDGKVTGVKAEDKAGNTYTIRADKNVVLSTGGFAGNGEMVQRFNTSGKWPDLSKAKSTNLPSITGDGIAMAEGVGAALRDMDQIQLLQTCSAKTGLLHANAYPGGVASYLLLNQEGKRFVREDGRRDDVSLAGLKQTNSMFYLFVSGDGIPDPDNTTDLGGIPLNDLIAMGDIYVGDTLEDACKQVGIDPVAAQATIDAYNQYVEEGAVADEFGRALLTMKLENGPWYITPRAPSVHHTMGGVVINGNCEVLDTNGNVIPGLYAAGEVTGGIHGGNRLGGNAIVDFVVFGRIAGDNASK
ncbi:flavocytochrome c [Christensenellaceae bacterium OttesenSCG-928-M15]|nr:flavocytochrome c [Christensenellaceae bacterium OttesenSCG-928-M15]